MLAEKSSMTLLHLDALISGTERFIPFESFCIETALGIEIKGFFYLIQSNHDIYLAEKESNSRRCPSLDILSKTTFWDTDLRKVDWSKCQSWAIRRVLEYGSFEEIREIVRFYGEKAVNDIYNSPVGFRLYNEVKRKYKSVI